MDVVTRCVFHLSTVVIRLKLSRTCDLSSFLIMINSSHFFKLTRCLNKTCHLTSVELIFQQIVNMSFTLYAYAWLSEQQHHCGVKLNINANKCFMHFYICMCPCGLCRPVSALKTCGGSTSWTIHHWPEISSHSSVLLWSSRSSAESVLRSVRHPWPLILSALPKVSDLNTLNKPAKNDSGIVLSVCLIVHNSMFH